METMRKNNELKILKKETHMGLSPTVKFFPDQPVGKIRLGLSLDMETIPDTSDKTDFFTP